MDENLQALENLEKNLYQQGYNIKDIPLVIQYNKRDLPNAAPVEYLEYLFNNRPTPFLSFESDARSGRNVLATLNAISQAVLHQFRLRTAPADSTSATPHELPTHALAA